MAAKTTFISGFLSIFVISALDLVENANNLENVSWHFFEKFGLKNLKIHFKKWR